MKFKHTQAIDVLRNTRQYFRSDISTAAHWLSKIGLVPLVAAAASIISANPREEWIRKTDMPGTPMRHADNASKIEKRLQRYSSSALLRRQTVYRTSAQKRGTDSFNLLAGADTCPGTIVPAGNYTAAAPFTDSGNTTGANDTITSWGYYDAAYGPDHIYTFTISSLGANPKIEVSTTSSTYDVGIYVVNGLMNDRCPNTVQGWFWWYPEAASYGAGPGNTETIDNAAMSELPLNVPLHLFVDSPSFQAASNAGPYTVKLQDVTLIDTPPVPPNDAPVDVSGDGKTDLSIVRNSGGQLTWFTRTSSDQFTTPQNWGVQGDKPVPADYDGDGRDDIAVWRPGPQGRFYVLGSRSQTVSIVDFGQTGDDPSVVADYTGDGADDIAVYRPGATPGAQSYWYYRSLVTPTNAFTTIPWGLHGDVPAPGNVDGYAASDFVVRRAEGESGRFYIRYDYGSTSYQESVFFGMANDTLVPGVYLNEYRATEFAVVRPGPDGLLHWYIRNLYGGQPIVHRIWGVAATDIPVPGDYDGDGFSELAVWRPGSPGAFYTMALDTGVIRVRQWGETNDVPVAAFNTH